MQCLADHTEYFEAAARTLGYFREQQKYRQYGFSSHGTTRFSVKHEVEKLFSFIGMCYLSQRMTILVQYGPGLKALAKSLCARFKFDIIREASKVMKNGNFSRIGWLGSIMIAHNSNDYVFPANDSEHYARMRIASKKEIFYQIGLKRGLKMFQAWRIENL